jgi:2-dehydro-3-deoxygluconokinase
MNDMDYDLVSLGEPLLRLSPPGRGQIRRAASFEARIVGSQLNVAANLARLGWRNAIITRLPDDPLGQLACDTILGYGVDTEFARMVAGGKLGVTYVEFSAAPRGPAVVYDRAGSAASATSADEFDWDAIARRTQVAYTDGIFPGLSAGCLSAAEAFLKAARRNGRTTCFDVNYREHLWTPASASSAWSRLLPLVDIVVTNRVVSESVFGFQGSDESLLRQYADQFGNSVVCLTARESRRLACGAWNSQALVGGMLYQGRPQEFEIVDRYGTGDAWVAGFLFGRREQPDTPAFALDCGNALCALAHTIEGDVAHVTPVELLAVAAGRADLRPRR